MKKFMALVMCFALLGCATYQPPTYFLTNQNLKDAGQTLVSDYLNGQLHGESTSSAAHKYGPGASEYYNLQDFQVNCVGQFYGHPAYGIRVKASNKLGGIFWKSQVITLSYEPQLGANDIYKGLRLYGIDDSDVCST